MMHKVNVLPHHPGCDCYVGGVVNWRTAIVHYVAKAVGLMVKVEGFPLGTSRNLDWAVGQETGCCSTAGARLGREA